jgi:hypothetical protein
MADERQSPREWKNVMGTVSTPQKKENMDMIWILIQIHAFPALQSNVFLDKP